MTALTLMITRAGQARFTAAQLDADINLGIASIGLTDAPFVSAPTLEAVPGEFKRLTSISGDQVGDAIVHLTMRDDSADGYSARGFGLFLADGTLFATYAQADRLFEKSPRAAFLAAIDIAFPAGDVSDLRFGDTSFLNPPATTTRKGVVELATQAEADAGTDTQRVPSVAVMGKIVAGLKASITTVSAALDSLSRAVTEALDGLASRTIYGDGLVQGGGRADTNRTLTVTAANGAQVLAGTRADVAITPAALAALAVNAGTTGEYSPCPGVYHKLGYVAGPFAEGPVTITFRTPFPTTCVIVIPIPINGSGSALRDIYMQEQVISREGATLFVQKAGSDGSNIDGFRYLAIGF